MHFVRLLHLFLLTISSLALFSPAGAQTLKLGHAVNAKSPYHLGAEKFADCLESATNGNLSVKIFPNRQLGDERALIEAVRMGMVDMAITSTGPLSNFDPNFAALDVPYLFTGYEEVDKILGGPLGRDFLDSLSSKDIIGLAFWENGFRHVTNSKRPIHEPSDLKGIKIRTMENKVHMDAFDHLGARAQAMPFGEALAALRQGALDGQENPVNIIHAFKLWELQDYLSLTGHVYSPAVIICSPKTWDKLSAGEKKSMRKCALEAAKEEKEFIRSREEEMLEEIQKQGMAVNRVDKKEFKEELKPLRKKNEKKMPWLKRIEKGLK
ncbi:MAG: TRAP transporter substrate-binding protein [Desulfonatronovibrionaceae bacterium]